MNEQTEAAALRDEPVARDVLLARLEECGRMIGRMCSEGRPPLMSIPVRADRDEDVFICDTLNMVRAALKLGDAVQGAPAPLKPEQVEWVVNDIAELGVKIGEQFFFLYKGRSLVYGTSPEEIAKGVCLNEDTDPPTVQTWRPVFKREFGECCHPVNYEDLCKCGHPHYIGTVSQDDSDEWKPIPPAQPQERNHE